ncbi:hypothetical protein [Moraxella lacunata]
MPVTPCPQQAFGRQLPAVIDDGVLGYHAVIAYLFILPALFVLP